MTRLATLAALALLLSAGLAPADSLPEWPGEQQAQLRQVEEELLDVQRALFKARQQGDTTALATQEPRFKALQQKRLALIELTRNQLPAEP